MRECTVCRSCFTDTVLVCDREGAPANTTFPIEPLVNGRYFLKKRIEDDSVSALYLATNQTDGKDCAIKIIAADLLGYDSSASNQFLLLARKAFTLRHPNIVTVTDWGLINNLLPFVTTDLVPGSSLHDALSKGRHVPLAEAVEYLTAIGGGLAHAHAQGVIHGDLKPRNILLQRGLPISQAIKIAGFGLSALKSGKVQSSTGEKSSGILRSPVYMAPEEWSEEDVDTRSDIYSLGIILYQMLVGELPFKGKSIPAIMKAHLVESPPRIAGRLPGLSPEIERVVLRALEKQPRNRPPTVDGLLEEFREAVTDSKTDEPVEDPFVDLNKTSVAGISIDAEEEPEAPAPVLSAAIQSVLLALGVVLVLALIGIGVYYSRMSQ
jgi:eukaryotic-like serine/threonine-protein kinase